MTMALPKGRSVVAAGFAAIAGAGLALGFTVLDSTTSTWILVLVAAVTLVSPVFAGWLSPGLKQAWFFPDRCAGEPVHRDGHPWATLIRL